MFSSPSSLESERSVDVLTSSQRVQTDAVPVLHVLDGVVIGKQYLWGKEQVVSNLMHAQRTTGRFAPALAVFAPCLLSERIAADGFQIAILDVRAPASPWRGLRGLVAYLRSNPSTIVHTHGYKANVVGRLARFMGAPMIALVSTSHGFDDYAARLLVYNAIDRVTGPASDVVTAPDATMLATFPGWTTTKFIPNGIPDQEPPTTGEKIAARRRFGWGDDEFVAGAMCRLSSNKGITELIAAAKATHAPVRWAAAGAGPMQPDIERCEPSRIQAVGYVTPSDDYVAAIDVYVQPSRVEGLSLSLLQAMRAGKPIVATRVNATELAIRDGIDGLLVDPRSASALKNGVERIAADRAFARRLGESARARFLENFCIERQAEAYEQLYLKVCAKRGTASSL
jgi:glycosyltransferase involved in cell wall biosynthesis